MNDMYSDYHAELTPADQVVRKRWKTLLHWQMALIFGLLAVPSVIDCLGSSTIFSDTSIVIIFLTVLFTIFIAWYYLFLKHHAFTEFGSKMLILDLIGAIAGGERAFSEKNDIGLLLGIYLFIILVVSYVRFIYSVELLFVNKRIAFSLEKKKLETETK